MNMNSSPKMKNVSKENYENCDSPLLTTVNQARKNDKMIKKDSCINFVMGKDSLFTGKV